MQLLSTIILVGILILILLTFHKVRRIHLMLYAVKEETSARIDNHFAQFEALLALYYELQPAVGFQTTRGWAGSPDFLLAAARCARGATTIVECSSGVSTVVLARAVEMNGIGHVYSLEHDLIYAEKTRKELERHKLDKFATVIHAPLVTHKINDKNWLWYDLGRLSIPSIDLLVIDGPPMNIQSEARYPAIPLLAEYLSKGALVILDDADRLEEKRIVVNWLEQFPIQPVQGYFAEKGISVLQIRND